MRTFWLQAFASGACALRHQLQQLSDVNGTLSNVSSSDHTGDGVPLAASLEFSVLSVLQTISSEMKANMTGNLLSKFFVLAQDESFGQMLLVALAAVLAAMLLALSVLFVSVLLGGRSGLGQRLLTSFGLKHDGGSSKSSMPTGVRAQVDILPRCPSTVVAARLPPGQKPRSRSGSVDSGERSNDSIPAEAVSLFRLVKLEAVVEVGGLPPLSAPITGRSCVLFSATASRQVHEGSQSAPIAFAASASPTFCLRLLGDGPQAPRIRVSVRGNDVSLFDMVSGHLTNRKKLSKAPEKWQDFVTKHGCTPTAAASGTTASVDDKEIDFEELVLPLGATVVAVGELFRDTDGSLFLRPAQLSSSELDATNANAASDSEDTPAANQAGAGTETLGGQIFISDDPILRNRKGSRLRTRHISWAALDLAADDTRPDN